MAPAPCDPHVEQARLLARAEQWFDRGRAALLGQIPCRRGCHRCCIGPFAITIADALMLQAGLAVAPPAARRDIQERADAQIETMEREFPALAQSYSLDGWADTAVDDLVARFADFPCPALDADGSCRVYAYRPLTCRTMGLPVRSGDVACGACEVQTSVPIVPLPKSFRDEENRVASWESAVIASCRRSTETAGEEMLLPYGFRSDAAPEQDRSTSGI